MLKKDNSIEIYQVKIRLRSISPSIWRRLLIRSDGTIAELYYINQIVMGWPNIHLHQLPFAGKSIEGCPMCGVFTCTQRAYNSWY
jgi:hypothetical protein